MLYNFFRINMPYGITRNEKNEWMCFNREYMPLGFNSTKHQKSLGIPVIENPYEIPVFTAYPELTDQLLIELGDTPGSIQKDESGTIQRVFFYNDLTNPVNTSKNKAANLRSYFLKMEKLFGLKQKGIKY